MKRALAAMTLACTLSVGVANADVFSVNVAGVIKIQIPASSLTLISIPMTKLPEYRGGVISNSTATTIVDSLANWGVGTFNRGVTNKETYGASTYFVELTDGAFEGRYAYIESNDTTTLFLNLPPDMAAVNLQGASYKIIAANRIRDIFGDPSGGGSVLAGGSSFSAADYILPWGGTSYDAPIFYNDGLHGGNPNLFNSWVQGASKANDKVIDRDAGYFVNRRGAVPTNIVVTGEVSKNDQAIVLKKGLNLTGGGDVTEISIGSTTLTNGIWAGSSFASADYVLGWAGAGYEAPVFFNDGLHGGNPALSNKWVQGGANVSSQYLVRAGSGYFLYKRTNDQVWVRRSPLK